MRTFRPRLVLTIGVFYGKGNRILHTCYIQKKGNQSILWMPGLCGSRTLFSEPVHESWLLAGLLVKW